MVGLTVGTSVGARVVRGVVAHHGSRFRGRGGRDGESASAPTGRATPARCDTAGVMAPDSIRRTAADSFDDFGAYLVSVEAVLEGTVDETCHRSPRIGDRYGKVRLSTAGRLRAAGFVLLATFDRPHFDIALPDLSDDTVKRLDECFDQPIPNPGRAAHE